MPTTDLAHPAEEVPGGGPTWDGAVWVAVRDIEDLGVLEGDRAVVLDGVLHRDGEAWPLRDLNLSDWALALGGLGLAGLAARVAERCGEEFDGSLEYLADWLSEQPWAPKRWWDDRSIGTMSNADVITAAASRLSLTDRLAVVVGLELAEGEVARWELHEGDRQWFVASRGDRGVFVEVYAHHTTDPLEALRLALRAVEGGGE